MISSNKKLNLKKQIVLNKVILSNNYKLTDFQKTESNT